MLASSLERLSRMLPDDAVVLDIGGWGKPFPRADWVMDLMPYDTRGLYGSESTEPERFTADTWIQRDICDREPFPFDDGAIDFVLCSHTLEDVRDPLWVCSEMNRIAKAGYIEVPSRLEEQAYGVQGPWVGWGHHRWLVDVTSDAIEFVFKHHIVHGRPEAHFPAGFRRTLSAEQRVLCLWWEGSFGYGERVFIEGDDLDRYLNDFVATHSSPAAPAPERSRARRAADRLRVLFRR